MPKDTESITLNKQTFSLSDFSHQGIGGVGKKMIKPIEDAMLDVTFNKKQEEAEKSVNTTEASENAVLSK